MQELRSAGHDVVAIAPHDNYSQVIVDKGFVYSDVCLTGDGVNPFRELIVVFKVWRLFKSCGVQCVLTYTPKPNVYGSLAALALGSSFFPNISGLGRVFIRKSILTFIVKVLYRFVLRRAALVFFQNNDDRSLFVKEGLVVEGRSLRIPGSGVDLDRFFFSRREKSDEIVFLLIARMLWDKGVGEFVAAARLVTHKFPSVKFVLLGSVGVSNPSAIPEAQIESWVAEGIVDYIGHVSDVRPHIEGADCVVLPSYREGLPRSLLEACAMGRPVIATDVAGCRDVVDHEVNGFLCNVQSAASLSEQMLRFCALSFEERSAMGEQARRFVEEGFSERVVLDAYLQAISKCDC